MASVENQSQPEPSQQCCSDHVEAAKKGHVECLRRLQEAGRFLGLHDRDRESAGEARKFEVWDAAVAACKEGHAQVLSWLFSEGWPDKIDAAVPWYFADLAEPWGEGDWEELNIPNRPRREELFLPEVKLYRYAMRNTDTSCLDALLNAGCRSDWLCLMAALEGREGHLALAAERGAWCDARTMYPAASRGNLPLLQAAHQHATIQPGFAMSMYWSDRDTLHSCFEAAAQNGHADCLAALLTWFDDNGLWRCASDAAGRGGHISCLEELRRRGWEDWGSAACNAAKAGQIDCLLYLLELRPLQEKLEQDQWTRSMLMAGAAGGGQLACLRLLHERGFAWDYSTLTAAIDSGNSECLQYALDHTEGDPEILLEEVYMCKSSSCFQVLCDRGCLAQPSEFWDLEPDFVPPFLECVDLQFLKTMVASVGPPPTHILSTERASRRGAAFLQYVHELGAPWDPTTMSTWYLPADSMRFAHENGCPWGQAVLSDFIKDVECLHYAHQNGCAYDRPARPATTLPDFQVLQYAWKHMDHEWAREVVGNVVKYGFRTRGGSGAHGVGTICDPEPVRQFAGSKYDWRVPLYLVKEMKMGRDELGILAQLADVRLARAAALAQCFYMAGKYVRELRSGPWADLWSAMARCPAEVREKIAIDAHLALPPL